MNPVPGAFGQLLSREFATRRVTNPRYSLRAFAVFLQVDHSTLSQILRGRRRVPPANVRAWARRLGLPREEMLAYVAAEQATDVRSLHWTAEAMAVIHGCLHWELWSVLGGEGFALDTRALARCVHATPDEVNVALTRLLRLRLIESRGGRWYQRASVATESQFRHLVLAQVRTQS